MLNCTSSEFHSTSLSDSQAEPFMLDDFLSMGFVIVALRVNGECDIRAPRPRYALDRYPSCIFDQIFKIDIDRSINKSITDHRIAKRIAYSSSPTPIYPWSIPIKHFDQISRIDIENYRFIDRFIDQEWSDRKTNGGFEFLDPNYPWIDTHHVNLKKFFFRSINRLIDWSG